VAPIADGEELAYDLVEDFRRGVVPQGTAALLNVRWPLSGPEVVFTRSRARFADLGYGRNKWELRAIVELSFELTEREFRERVEHPEMIGPDWAEEADWALAARDRGW